MREEGEHEWTWKKQGRGWMKSEAVAAERGTRVKRCGLTKYED